MSTNRFFPSVIWVKTAPIWVPWSVCLPLWCLCSSTAIAEPGWAGKKCRIPLLGCCGAFPPLFRENWHYICLELCRHTLIRTQLCPTLAFLICRVGIPPWPKVGGPAVFPVFITLSLAPDVDGVGWSLSSLPWAVHLHRHCHQLHFQPFPLAGPSENGVSSYQTGELAAAAETTVVQALLDFSLPFLTHRFANESWICGCLLVSLQPHINLDNSSCAAWGHFQCPQTLF